MTGSIALDVVIGLVFVYSLYSLLTTTITEMFASLIRLRASFLEQGIRRMLDDGSGVKEMSDKFFNQPLIKYLGSGKFFGLIKKPSYLSAQNFSKALIEVLKEKGKKAHLDPEIIQSNLDKIKKALETKEGEELKHETIVFVRSLLEDAQNDLDKFKDLLEQWYDDTMERVSGWYKKRIQLITFLIGFIVAGLFNVDTIKIVQKLSHDPKAREQYVQIAEKLASNKDLANKVFGDSVNQAKNYDTLRQAFTELRKQAIESNEVITVKRDPFGWDQFLGWLITAIALSLGAPFWFDLLNKLMKLRSSVQAASSPSSGADNKQTPAVKRVG